MFTGIIEEIGTIKTFNDAKLQVICRKVLEGTNLGDSIAINGVCQTVVEMQPDSFTVQVSNETLSVTTLGTLKQGDKVNLERALTLSSRLGGHLVSGHVDCRGKLLTVQKHSEFYDLEFEIPQEQTKYVVKKGSVTINGISLTVANISGRIIKVAIIPHTYNNTNLSELKSGDYVNIETDILGKYVEKILSANDNNNSNISMEFLHENGFV